MKVYIICEVGYEYNDECYDRIDDEQSESFGKPTVAYRNKDKAAAECAKLNEKEYAAQYGDHIDDEENKWNNPGIRDYDGNRFSEFYFVKEIELEEV